LIVFFFQAEDGIRDFHVTGVQTCALPISIFSALSCAHRLGVVHGDLKPSNLLLSKDYAGRPHPWVLDFGVSFFSAVDAGLDPTRSEERRVGKERWSRWEPSLTKKKFRTIL